MLYLTDFSTASKRLNLNNVAEVERKESLFSLPRCSNVSKKPHTKSCEDWGRDWKEQPQSSQGAQCGVIEIPPILRVGDTLHWEK